MLQRRSTTQQGTVFERNAMTSDDQAERDPRHINQMPFQQLLLEKLFF